MNHQRSYWNRVAYTKTFTHPLPCDLFRSLVPKTGRILDCGCGYGRTCDELTRSGYKKITGVDTSPEMIKRGLEQFPKLDLRVLENDNLPFNDQTFDACLILAVLTCMPSNRAQEYLIQEIERVLKPGGILLLSDYPLQHDKRNSARYEHFKDEFGLYGVFKLPDGGVVRHHDMDWITSLLSSFQTVSMETVRVSTMNGNSSEIFQITTQKRA